MDIDLNTIPDDLRVRYYRSALFRVNNPKPLPMFIRPFNVFAAVEEGEVETVYGSGRNKVFRMKKGDVGVHPANIKRYNRSNGGLVLNAAYRFEIRGGIDLLSFAGKPFYVTGQAGKKLYDLLRELLGTETQPGSRTQLEQSISRQKFGYAMLECILKVFSPKPEIFVRRQIFPAIEYLDEYYSQPLDIDRLLELSHMSRTHFFRVFKEQTGKTPVEFLKQRRLREALLLLQYSDLTVGEIAYKIGWPDQFYFSKIFKNEIGLAPSQYRARQNNFDCGNTEFEQI